MFHVGLSKEFPVVPFIRDNSGIEYPVIFQKELTGRDCSKFMKTIKLENLISGAHNVDLDFNVVIQSLTNKNETNICFHTWALQRLSKKICVLPNDDSINIESNFKYTICSLVPTFSTAENTVFVDGSIKVCKKSGLVGFYPLSACKFILNTNAGQQFYVLVSILRDGKIESINTKENSSIIKDLNKIAITLHILVDSKMHNIKMDHILTEIKNVFGLDVN